MSGESPRLLTQLVDMEPPSILRRSSISFLLRESTLYTFASSTYKAYSDQSDVYMADVI